MQDTMEKSAMLMGGLGFIILLFTTYKGVGLGFMAIGAGFLAIKGLIWLYDWYKRRDKL